MRCDPFRVNAAAAPATVGGEPLPKTAVRPSSHWETGKAGKWRRPASQETCRPTILLHRAGCSGGSFSITAGGFGLLLRAPIFDPGGNAAD